LDNISTIGLGLARDYNDFKGASGFNCLIYFGLLILSLADEILFI
jgi:hypothetical protein